MLRIVDGDPVRFSCGLRTCPTYQEQQAGAAMRRTIATLDLASGRVSERPSNTPTVDVPHDFDRTTTSGLLDVSSHLHYATYGKPIVRPAFVRPLSWRTRGEECLVEEEGAANRGHNRFVLCAVERLPLETRGERPARAEEATVARPARKAKAPKKAVDTFGRMLRAARAGR